MAHLSPEDRLPRSGPFAEFRPLRRQRRPLRRESDALRRTHRGQRSAMNRADNGERRAGRERRDTVNAYHFHTEKA